jgi:hypothetical protein
MLENTTFHAFAFSGEKRDTPTPLGPLEKGYLQFPTMEKAYLAPVIGIVVHHRNNPFDYARQDLIYCSHNLHQSSGGSK